MQVILYSPWLDNSFKDLATRYALAAAGRTHKGNKKKLYKFIRHHKGGRQLGLLNPLVDRLYVLGHGQTASAFIRADKGMTWSLGYDGEDYEMVSPSGVIDAFPALSPQHLVSNLKSEGLQKGFVDIRLWCCNQGVMPGDFGQLFAHQLTKPYPCAKVTVYTGAMKLGTESGRKTGVAFSKPGVRGDAPSDPAHAFKTIFHPPYPEED